MNLVKCVVKEVVSEPYFRIMYRVDVIADCHGSLSEDVLLFETEEEALGVSSGYEFDA